MPAEHLVKVILPHEVAHIVNGHLDRYADSLFAVMNHKILNIAMDLAINNNGFIDMSYRKEVDAELKRMSGNPEAGAMYPDMYKLPDKQTSDFYLNAMFEMADKNTSGEGESLFKPGQGPKGQGSGKGSGQGDGAQEPGDGEGGDQPGDGENKTGDPKHGGQHPFLEDDGVSKSTRQSIKESTLRQAYKEWSNNHSKNRGNMPGGVSELIEEILFPKKSAAQLFRNVIGQWIGSRWEWSSSRINKRLCSYSSPGKKLRPRLRLALVIDTSGSMSNRELSIFRGLVQRTQREMDAELIVMHTDTEVCKVETLKGHKAPVKFHGRGGTDFSPAFKYLRDKKIRPDGVIFFTDGCGALEPELAKGFRTAWFLTPGGSVYDFMKARGMTIIKLEECSEGEK
jgi:predicted metal-dependent peptidase